MARRVSRARPTAPWCTPSPVNRWSSDRPCEQERGCMKRKVMLCMGHRPKIIKMAPVHHAINAAGMQSVVFHTGQHREIAMPLYRLFDVDPVREVVQLDRKGGSLAELGSALLEA